MAVIGLGHTIGKNDKGENSQRVLVENQPIIKFQNGNRTTIFSESNTDQGNEITVLSYTLASELVLCEIGLSTQVEGVGFLYLDDVKIRSLRTSASEKNPSKSFLPNYTLNNGTKIEIKFLARNNSATTSIEAYLDLVE